MHIVKKMYLAAAAIVFLAQTVILLLPSNASAFVWAPGSRTGPEIIDIQKERWIGYDTYNGSFWMYHGFSWTPADIQTLKGNPRAIASDTSLIYEFRRGWGNTNHEHWDGAWAKDESRCFWFFICIGYVEQVVTTEYITSLPHADNHGLEESDDWFTRIPNHIPIQAPPSWQFDMCDIERLVTGMGCAEEYEISSRTSMIQPNRYYFVMLRFRTDEGDGNEETPWYVSFNMEYPTFPIGYEHLAGAHCLTDRGALSIAYDPTPGLKMSQVKETGCVDSDGDGSIDSVDNCVQKANPDQADADGDAKGDACDPCPLDADNDRDGDGICGNVDPFPGDSSNDSDGDGVAGSVDNCPSVPNADQLNHDSDSAGDACDNDDDGDGFADKVDAFPIDPTEWLDTDGDKVGNNADRDDDNDGYLDFMEVSLGTDPLSVTSKPQDFDGDFWPDAMDPDDDNDGVNDTSDDYPKDAAEYRDSDGDGKGDNADTDDDDDGYSDTLEVSEGTDPLNPFSTPFDFDGDMIPDGWDTDDDNDGIPDSQDAMPFDATEGKDNDSDGLGDGVDLDDDNDLYPDTVEISLGTDPEDAKSTPPDHDKDLLPDAIDTDDDNDGTPDVNDAFPFDPVESVDTDKDGTGDNTDTDDDNDCYLDTVEASEGSNPLDQTSKPADNDSDCKPDATDTDDDNDGTPDVNDAFPFDPVESVDTDKDGIGDNADTDDDNDCYSDAVEAGQGTDPLSPSSKPPDNDGDCSPDKLDSDDDNDGVPDSSDALPFDPSESVDTDGDGVGNNADADDDNDGYTDAVELSEGTNPLSAASTPADYDGDKIPNSTDTDDDNDGIPDSSDAFPLNPSEWADTDGDGVGNNTDTDDDGDCYSDAVEAAEGTVATDSSSKPADNDSDCDPDSTDSDDDNDGMPDTWEVTYELNPKNSQDAWDDADKDGLANITEYKGGTNPRDACSPPRIEQFCYDFYADGDAGQCRGATGKHCVSLEEWTSPIIIDTDGRGGGCWQSFSIRSSCSTLPDMTFCMDFQGDSPTADIGQCGNAGSHCAAVNEWTSPIWLDMDGRGGWCTQRFSISGPNDYTFSVDFKASEGSDANGQCKSVGRSTSYSEKKTWTSLIGLDTDDRGGWCEQRFQLGQGSVSAQ